MVRFLTIFFSLFVASPVQAAPAARAVMENIPTKSSVNASGFFGPLVGNVTGNLTGNADTATSATSVSAGGVNLSTVTTRFQLVEASTGNLYATKLASGTAIPSSLVNLSTVAAKITPTLTGPVTIVAPPAQYGLEMNGDVRLSSSMVTVGAGNISIGGSGAFIGPLTGNAATVTTNANLTGPITSVGNATTIAGPVPTATVDLSTVTTALNLKAPIASPAFTGNVSGPSSATFNAFFGDGSALTNITATDSSKVAKAGDTMTGELIMNLSAGTTGLSVLTASGVNVKGTGVAIRARSDGKALVIKNAADTQESVVLNGNGVTLLTGFTMPSGGDGGNMTLGVPANFNAGLSGTMGSFSGSVTASSVTSQGGIKTGGANGAIGGGRTHSFGLVAQPAYSTANTLRIGDSVNTNGLDFGVLSGPPYGSFLQSSSNDGGSDFPLILQPRGSSVGIGTASPASKLHMSSGTLTIDGDTPSGFPLSVTNGGGNSNRGTQAKFGSDTYVSNFGGATYLTALSELSNSGVWTARGTTAAGIGVNETNGIVFNINSGLVSGNTFSPTARATLTTTGLGIGVAAPATALEVNGGARLNTVTAQPACAVGIRGTFWATQGAAGVKDTVQVCAKDAADAYAWRVIY